MLNNYDISNFLHRESIIIENIEYLLTSIEDYDPVEPESTACRMWMFVPVNEIDKNVSYPSIENIQTGGIYNSFEAKYCAHTLLTTDLTESINP
jgi:hypothetical protein